MKKELYESIDSKWNDFSSQELLTEAFSPKFLVSAMYKLQDLMQKVEEGVMDYDDWVDDVNAGDKKSKEKPPRIRNLKKFDKTFDAFKSELEITKTQLRKIWPR